MLKPPAFVKAAPVRMSGRASLDLLRPDPVTFPRGVADQELRGIANFGSNTPFSVARHFWKCVIKTRAAGWPSCNSAALSFARKSKRLVVIFGLGRSPKQPSPQIFLFFLFLVFFLFFTIATLLLSNRRREKILKKIITLLSGSLRYVAHTANATTSCVALYCVGTSRYE